MRFDVITLFPEMFEGILGSSILKRAQEQGLITVKIHNLRDWATDNHKTVDDTPYGGGAGMLLKIDVLHAAITAVQNQPDVSAVPKEQRRSLLLAAQGKRLTQPRAQFAASNLKQITLICGHYEGVDARIHSYIDGELSIGEYVLTGGELPAMIAIDAISRLLPEVIREESPEEESFSIMDGGKALLEYPHYTRPAEFQGETVPDVLVSGNHTAIASWRLEQARERTNNQASDADQTL
jgi:tRNA (guanine37-N1)-methyltransferase